MQRYFFDIHACSLACQDVVGQILKDPKEARAAALKLMRDVATKLLHAGEPLTAVVVASDGRNGHLSLSLCVNVMDGLLS